jgi:hypothetical protein
MIGKLAITVAAWLVVTLVVAATIELTTGRQLPAATAIVTLVAMVPLARWIWRPKSRP